MSDSLKSLLLCNWETISSLKSYKLKSRDSGSKWSISHHFGEFWPRSILTLPIKRRSNKSLGFWSHDSWAAVGRPSILGRATQPKTPLVQLPLICQVPWAKAPIKVINPPLPASYYVIKADCQGPCHWEQHWWRMVILLAQGRLKVKVLWWLIQRGVCSSIAAILRRWPLGSDILPKDADFSLKQEAALYMPFLRPEKVMLSSSGFINAKDGSCKIHCCPWHNYIFHTYNYIPFSLFMQPSHRGVQYVTI